MKRYYREFVRHCLSYYVSTLEIGTSPKFKSAADRANWVSCQAVAINLDPDDLALMCEIYGPGDTIPDKIYHLSKARRQSQSYLWGFVEELEYKVAKKRGLI